MCPAEPVFVEDAGEFGALVGVEHFFEFWEEGVFGEAGVVSQAELGEEDLGLDSVAGVECFGDGADRVDFIDEVGGEVEDAFVFEIAGFGEVIGVVGDKCEGGEFGSTLDGGEVPVHGG